MGLHAISADSYGAYSQDLWTGRCRVPNNLTISSQKVGMGWIASLQLTDKQTKKERNILTTIWPDVVGVLNEDECVVDETVMVSGSPRMDLSHHLSNDVEVEISQLQAPRNCSSVSLVVTGEGAEDFVLPLLYGLPVISGCNIHLTMKGLPAIDVQVLTANPEGMSIIGPSTIRLLNSPTKSSVKPAIDAAAAVCRTNAVDELLSRVVQPVLAGVPPDVRFRGMMLLGPPGVGKSFSLRAVQRLAPPNCQIRLSEVSIPELLAEESPLVHLESMLDKVRATRPVDAPAKPAPIEAPPVASPTESVEQKSTGKFSHASSLQAAMKAAAEKRAAAKLAASKTVVAPTSSESNEEEPFVVHFVLIDEIDALGHSHNQNEIQLAIKQQLCRWLDDSSTPTKRWHTCLVATSNRVEDIDSCFRRGGRLEHELHVLNLPADRRALLTTYITALIDWLRARGEHSHCTLDGRPISLASFIANLKPATLTLLNGFLCERTGGYVAADLSILVRELQIVATRRSKVEKVEAINMSSSILDSLENSVFGAVYEKFAVLRPGEVQDDSIPQDVSLDLAFLLRLFDELMRTIGPSCLRGVNVALPRLGFDDVIGYAEAKYELSRALSFVNPTKKARLQAVGLSSMLGGVLLYGPPGNSKTRLITAAAASHGLPLISLSSADIYSAYVGDAENEVRRAFTLARQAAPCILFFDEMDSFVTNRAQQSGSGSASVEARVLSTFLNEMDGVNTHAGSAGVIVVGATNRIDCIDSALIRKGRFYKTIHIPPPNDEERKLLLAYFCRRSNLDEETEAQLRLRLVDGMSGADVESLTKEASIIVMQKQLSLKTIE